jgi:hypothetical protein
VEDGSMENSTKAVKELLIKAEKDIKTDRSERLVVRIKKIIAYLNFKREVDEVVRNNLIYGNKSNRSDRE